MEIKIDGKIEQALLLHIKGQWFQMILSGEKKEEYRSISRYYRIRFRNNEMLDYSDRVTRKPGFVLFQNGYSQDSPQFVARCVLTVGEGNPEWGAIPGEIYYKLSIEEILNEKRFERQPVKRE